MTRIEQARQGVITDEIRQVASDEGLDAETVAERLATGELVITRNLRHGDIAPLGIGRGLDTQVRGVGELGEEALAHGLGRGRAVDADQGAVAHPAAELDQIGAIEPCAGEKDPRPQVERPHRPVRLVEDHAPDLERRATQAQHVAAREPERSGEAAREGARACVVIHPGKGFVSDDERDAVGSITGEVNDGMWIGSVGAAKPPFSILGSDR